MKITIGNRQVILPEGQHLIDWIDKMKHARQIAEKVDDIINGEPADQEEARRIEWLVERLGT